MVSQSDGIVLSKRRIGKTCTIIVLSVALFLLVFFIVDVGVFYALCGLFVTPTLFAYVVAKIVFRSSSLPKSSPKGKNQKRKGGEKS